MPRLLAAAASNGKRSGEGRSGIFQMQLNFGLPAIIVALELTRRANEPPSAGADGLFDLVGTNQKVG